MHIYGINLFSWTDITIAVKSGYKQQCNSSVKVSIRAMKSGIQVSITDCQTDYSKVSESDYDRLKSV